MKPTFVMNKLPSVVCASAVLLLAGCAVGPDYHRPAPLGANAIPFAFEGATNSQWKTAQPSAHLARGAWWEVFGDPELNRLQQLAATNNQQLAASVANLSAARAQVNISRSGYFPQLSGSGSYTRKRTSANQSVNNANSSTYGLFNVPLDASWELDLFGRARRTVESSRNRMAATEDDLESLKLAIQAEVAMDYFTLKSQDAQHRLFDETVVTYKRSLELTENRHAAGIVTELDVAQAETQLRTAEAEIPAIDLKRAQLRHALATLCGQPATLFEVTPATNTFSLPQIPLAVPSQLLEQRPDVASAERRMAAANADVGVAHGAFYPSVTLSGLGGFESVSSSTLFNWDSRYWAVGPTLSLPIFSGGKNRAQLASSRAAYDAAVANYRQSVLSAFQDVEDQLVSQDLLAKEYAAENAALTSARRTLDISMTRYKGGVITYLDVATAQNIALSHEQTVVQLTATRLNAAVSLIKALGGGWVSTNAPAHK